MENITMSRKESQQVPIFDRLLRQEISQGAAAKILRISDRQVRNKLKRYKGKGPEGLIHRSRGKPSSRGWNSIECDFAIKLFENEFKNFGPTFASEKLKEIYQIKVSKETLRKKMIEFNVWSGKKRRPVYRSRRPRKLNFGQMVQVDGSPHDWLEGRGPKATLLVFIDDATSEILWLYFAKSESTKSLMEATKQYVLRYGRPLSIYVDFGSVFSVNTNNPERDKLTQYERAMKELGIEVKHAHSPQAKGRVERANKTLQDRLIKEMRLADISSIDQANKFVQEIYINKHNNKFAVTPELKQDLHRPASDFDLNQIFCLKEVRIMQNDFVINYKNKLLQLHKDQRTAIFPKDKIVIYEALDHKLSLYIRRIKLDFNEILIRPAKPISKKENIGHSLFRKPAANHPWRNYNQQRI